MLTHVMSLRVEVNTMQESAKTQARRRLIEAARANRDRVAATRNIPMPTCPPQDWWYTRPAVSRKDARAGRPNRWG